MMEKNMQIWLHFWCVPTSDMSFRRSLKRSKKAKIYVAGHRGMVGSAIVRELQRQGYTNIVTRTHKELDLTRQDAVEKFFAAEKPEYVFLAAAKVGGIVANQNALADFMYDNMILEMNVIHEAWKNNCKKLLFLGSSCIYPRMAPQPMPESCLAPALSAFSCPIRSSCTPPLMLMTLLRRLMRSTEWM